MTADGSMTSATQALPDVVYPESDGRPMGETGFHVTAILLLRLALQELFRDRPDVYVAADMFLYYEEGNPAANKAPDVMVIPGIGNQERRIVKTWETGTVPRVIVEISSESTWREDLFDKRDLYARLGVAEYFLFDPLGDCLNPRLQGFRLAGPQYVPLAADADGGLTSEALGGRLVPDGGILRVIDSRTNQRILTPEEKSLRLRHESEQREREAQRADQEHQRADQERQRAEALAAEVARLRALLDQRDRPE